MFLGQYHKGYVPCFPRRPVLGPLPDVREDELLV